MNVPIYEYVKRHKQGHNCGIANDDEVVCKLSTPVLIHVQPFIFHFTSNLV